MEYFRDSGVPKNASRAKYLLRIHFGICGGVGKRLQTEIMFLHIFEMKKAQENYMHLVYYRNLRRHIYNII